MRETGGWICGGGRKVKGGQNRQDREEWQDAKGIFRWPWIGEREYIMLRRTSRQQ